MEGSRSHGFAGLESWRRDMQARDSTQAKKIMMEQAEYGSVTAAKALKEWEGKSKKSKSKAQRGMTEGSQNVVDFQKEFDKLKKK